MKIKILLFEPNEILRVTLSEQLLIKKDYDVTLASSLQDFKWHAEKSMFDLLIMGEKEEVYNISSFVEFIKESQITNKILFLIEPGSEEVSITERSSDQYHIINKPFKFQHFMKKINFLLAKLSGADNVSHVVGPFIFFPKRKMIKTNDRKKIELTEKEVDILRCLLSTDEEIVDREKLLKQVWNYNPDVTTHTLDTHIYRLRQKLEKNPSIPRLIISEGGGFKINQF